MDMKQKYLLIFVLGIILITFLVPVNAQEMETHIAEKFINTYRECQTDEDCSTICDEYKNTNWYICNVKSCSPKCNYMSGPSLTCHNPFEFYDTEDLIRDKAKNIILQFVDENYFLENYKERTIQRNRGIWYENGALVLFDICKENLEFKKAHITTGNIVISKEEAENIADNLGIPKPYESKKILVPYAVQTHKGGEAEFQKRTWQVINENNLMPNVACDELGAIKIDAETGEIVQLGYKNCASGLAGGGVKWKTPIQNIIYYYVIGFVILAIVILFVVWKRKK